MGAISLPSQHILAQASRKTIMASVSLYPSPFVRIGRGSSCSRSSVAVSSKSKRQRDAEDADKVLDELLNKYGKVVYSSSNSPSPSVSNSPDDDECLSFAVTLAKIADEVKAEDTRLLYVKPLVYWTRFFIIATAFSNPQINAIGSKMRDIAEKKFGKLATGDVKPNAWTLLDFGDVVVHIFLPPQRTYYNLEEFYGNAIAVEIPFDTRSTSSSQSPFQS